VNAEIARWLAVFVLMRHGLCCVATVIAISSRQGESKKIFRPSAGSMRIASAVSDGVPALFIGKTLLLFGACEIDPICRHRQSGSCRSSLNHAHPHFRL
jgi:hypothetical protein